MFPSYTAGLQGEKQVELLFITINNIYMYIYIIYIYIYKYIYIYIYIFKIRYSGASLIKVKRTAFI